MAALACGSSGPRQLNLYPSPTLDATATSEPTQTPAVILIYAATYTPLPSPSPFVPYTATVAGAWYCRERADLASKTVEYIDNGQRVQVIGISGAWLKIRTDRAECFISGVAIR